MSKPAMAAGIACFPVKTENGCRCSAYMQVPEYTSGFYSDEAIGNPWPEYQALRALGPVVYLSRLQNCALTQHAEVQQALRNDATYKCNVSYKVAKSTSTDGVETPSVRVESSRFISVLTTSQLQTAKPGW